MIDRELSWYRFFVHNQTYLGSCITLLHLPFLLMFWSLVILGTWTLQLAIPKLLLCLSMVFFLVYAEHCLDDCTYVGKPWQTRFNDTDLKIMAGLCYLWAFIICLLLHNLWALMGCSLGSIISVLYVHEAHIGKFSCHSVGFGALGMGGVSMFSYLVFGGTNIVIWLSLGLVGFCLGYIVNDTYRLTKKAGRGFVVLALWQLLGIIFLLTYSLAFLVLVTHLL